MLGIRLVLLVLEQEDKRGRYDVDEAEKVHELGEIDKRVGLSGQAQEGTDKVVREGGRLEDKEERMTD